jgi:hypothetical protein
MYATKACNIYFVVDFTNLYKGPSIGASYQVSVHLAKGFQRRRLKYEKLMDDGRHFSCELDAHYL